MAGERDVPMDIRVEGVKELRKQLLAMDKQWASRFKDANAKAAEIVVSAARARAPRVGRMAAKAAQTLRVARTQTAAAVRFGGSRAPFALGAEFGAVRGASRSTSRGPRRGWNQFQPHRGGGMSAGYFLYPAIRENQPEIIDTFLAEIDAITRDAFPE